MGPIICPACQKHMSVFEVACFHCGFIMTDDERDRQLIELEKQRQQESLKWNSPHAGELKNHRNYLIEKKINAISIGFFKTGWVEMVVPLIIILLIFIVVIIMFI